MESSIARCFFFEKSIARCCFPFLIKTVLSTNLLKIASRMHEKNTSKGYDKKYSISHRSLLDVFTF